MKWVAASRCGLNRQFCIRSTWIKFILVVFLWICFQDNRFHLWKNQFPIEFGKNNIKCNTAVSNIIFTIPTKFNRHSEDNASLPLGIISGNLSNHIHRKKNNTFSSVSVQINHPFPTQELSNNFLRARKRSEYVWPLKLDVSLIPIEAVVLEKVPLFVKFVDQEGSTVGTHRRIVKSQKILLNGISTYSSPILFVQRNITATMHRGDVDFKNLKFISTGKSLRIRMTLFNFHSGEINKDTTPWTSGTISVKDRNMILKPASKSIPRYSREHETFSPLAGVISYNKITRSQADKNHLSKYTWDAQVSLLYNGVYPGILSDNHTLVINSIRVIFSDITVTGWGYSYILRVNVRAVGSSYWNMHCLIGPCNVIKASDSEEPEIESFEHRTVVIAFDGNFEEVRKDPQKFNIFFLKEFGLKYPKVKWRNVTTSEGSVIVNAVITGLTENLEDTTRNLASDILDGKADIEYLSHKKWKASLYHVPMRRLLQEGGETQNKEDTPKEEEGLPAAWIAAIVINVVLVLLFIFAVIFCYCRNRRKRRDSLDGTINQSYRGEPEMLFVNKATNKGTEKVSLIRNEQPSVFTVEEERRKLDEDDEEVDQFSHAESRARCTCASPECYCSVGDYHKEEDLKTIQRKTDDMEERMSRGSYRHTPETAPVESPEPDPDDEFWRPDSGRYRTPSPNNYEEPQEYSDAYLPGTVMPEPARETRFLVYRVMDDDGSREFISHVTLPDDGTSMTLHDLRRYLQERELSSTLRNKTFRLMSENLKEIPAEQLSRSIDDIYPSGAINIKFGIRRFKPPVLQRPRPPVYLGPLGICGAPDCYKPSRLKCLDCGNAAYCGTRCMRDDQKAHKKLCFKPAWRM